MATQNNTNSTQRKLALSGWLHEASISNWYAANTIGKMVTGVVALLIWVPVLFLVVMIFSAPV